MAEVGPVEVRRVLPEPGTVDAAALLDDLAGAQDALTCFEPAVVAFAADLSARLRRHPDVRAHPALGALAWWIRPASIERLQAEWASSAPTACIRAPRGVVFHLPPTNVDTLFVYSWLLSALAGNANVIRLSPAAADEPGPLLGVIADVLADHPAVRSTTAIVSYGHDEAVTAALSGGDMRVVWGGDETVRTIRRIPLAPHATELAFPDRFSFCLLDAAAVLALTDADLDALLHRFVNDSYWFDQLGCASPRLVVWRGEPGVADDARERWTAALTAQLDARGDPAAPSTVVAKLVHAASAAADGAVTRITWSSNEVTLAALRDLGSLRRDGPGGGLFYEATIGSVDELIPHVRRRDQTMTTFGVDRAELAAFAEALGSRGIDRIVAVGDALTFSHHWDGHDLLRSFTREIYLGID